MKLSFYAKGSLLVTLPNQVVNRRNVEAGTSGSPLRYIGRVHIPAKTVGEGKDMRVLAPASNPASKEPYTVDASSERGLKLIKKLRQDPTCLFTANEETAKFLRDQHSVQIKHVEVSFKDGVWSEKNPAPLLNRDGKVKHCSPVKDPAAIKAWCEKHGKKVPENLPGSEAGTGTPEPSPETNSEPTPEPSAADTGKASKRK